MVSITEAAGQQSQLQAALNQGLQSIDRNQTVTFTQYTKTILPADGYVFWVQTGTTETVNGSIHYAIDKHQNEDETIAINRVIFSSETEIQVFDSVSPTTIFIGTFDGRQFAFSSQGRFYEQAGVWHYQGDAVYPALASQLVTSSAALSALEPIVSNSLPIWLSQTQYGPVYPSFLVPDNVTPPYIVAHIEPEDTEALQQFPVFTWPGVAQPGDDLATNLGFSIAANDGATIVSDNAPFHNLPSDQLMRDRVRLTLYGFNNQTAIQFLVSLMQYSINTDAFGFMNSPAIKDDKRGQVELSILAQKKHIEIIASYYQSTTYAIAQRLINSANATEIPVT